MERKPIIFCVLILGALSYIYILFWSLWTIDVIMPIPPSYDHKGAGFEYANLLAERAQKLSLLLIIVGWPSVTVGGLLAIAGAVLGSKPLKGENSTIISVMGSQRGLICASLAIVFGGFGWQCIDRSASATKTASVATTAIATASVDDKDKKAYNACVEAKAAWLEGRMNFDRLQSIVTELKK